MITYIFMAICIAVFVYINYFSNYCILKSLFVYNFNTIYKLKEMEVFDE